MSNEILSKLEEMKEQIESLSLSSKEILTLEEAVTYLQLSKSYLYKLTHRKEIPFYKPSGKLIFFKKSELDQWIVSTRESSCKEVSEDVLSNLKKREDGAKH